MESGHSLCGPAAVKTSRPFSSAVPTLNCLSLSHGFCPSQPPKLLRKAPEVHQVWIDPGANKVVYPWGPGRAGSVFASLRWLRWGAAHGGGGRGGSTALGSRLIGLGWPKRFVDWDNKSVVCFLACWGEDYKLSHKGMQIASQTLREACGVASYLEHLCGSVPLFLTILCFSISPNNCEGPESSHCIHLKSMAFPHQTL